MMRKIFSILVVLAIWFSTSYTAKAQMSYGGEPYSFNLSISQHVPTIEVEALDVAKLLEEDAENPGKDHALRIGVTKDVNYSIANSGRMDLLSDGGRVWRIAFHMEDATFTSMNFSKFNIPDGAELYLYTPDKEYVIGKFTNKNQMEDGTFYPQELPGEDIVVEYYEPAGADFEGELVIDQISQGYYDFFNTRIHRGGLGDAEGTCHPNAICYDDTWHAQINSAVCYTITSGGFVYMCSGAMINNTVNDNKQYLLTANHCYLSGATYKFYFQYQATTCNGTHGSIIKTATGATVRAKDNDSSSDFMLVEITGTINPSFDVYLAGWDISTSTPDQPTECATIHHPGGDIKKFSIPQNINDGSLYGYNKFWVANWSYYTGTTEQGSSGAPLFNKDKLIVGQFYAGTSSCVATSDPGYAGPDGEDFFGKLSYSWENSNNSSNTKKLKPWLDPNNTGATTLQGRWLNDPIAVTPTVTTSEVSNISDPYATCGGNVTDDGGATVTARGVCWSTSPNPTLNDSHTTDGSGTGEFTSTLNELVSETIYYVRAYATNSVGTAYGNEVIFSTSCGNVIVEISGNSELCAGDTATLIATGASTYQWNTGDTGDILQTSAEGTYSVIGTDTNGCLATTSITVTVHIPTTPPLTVDGEITACYESTATLSTEGNFTSYLWSTGETTPTIEVSTPGYYWVQVTDEYGCVATSEVTHLGSSILIPEIPAICMVGVENNHNLIVWEEIDNTNVRNYRVYREDNQANVFELLTTQPASQGNSYEDSTANPSVRAYRYKVTAMDVCQGETPMSEFHKTIHLTINRGIGESWNLIWTPYEGMEFPSYRLYRGTTPDSLELIATIPSTLTTLTDFEAPEGALYYQIEMVMDGSCQLHTRDVTDYAGARSNIVYNGEPAISGISGYTTTNLLTLYPNPTNDIVNVRFTNGNGKWENTEIRVYDVYGRLLRTVETCHGASLQTMQIDLSSYATGVYLIKLVNDGNVLAVRKVVKE